MTSRSALPVGNGHGNGQYGKAGAPGGMVTVEVLNQLIRENPANMSAGGCVPG